MNKSIEQFDVVVIGGGPAGSTAATFIAMQGHRVLLLEREAFPVYKIGESLLPSTIHGICPLLGVSEELQRANFVRKQGGTFRWGKKPEPWTFTFSESSAIRSPTSFAYQVERMKFDSILLNNARRKGVEVREKNNVSGLIMEDGRVAGIVCETDTGERRSIGCKYVVDASGHSSSIARHAGERIYSQFFKNVAVFGYYLGGKRLPPPKDGNIFCAAFDKGWFWYIPLSRTLTSVGAVIGQEHAQVLHQGPPNALSELIQACAPIRDLLQNATRVTDGQYGEVRVRKDYSYSHTRFWRPGLVLIGDAACFIDPVFSSGVHLATYSALLAARSINTHFRKVLGESAVFDEFENRYRREYRYFYDFLVSFYDMDQDLDAYYWVARKVINSEERGNESFIRLVAGVAGSGEQLHDTAEEFMKAREGIGQDLFPGPAGANPETAQSAKGAKFMQDFRTELSQVQLQATLGGVPPFEQPLFPGGLVPSPDGFHWAEPRQQPARTTTGARSIARYP